MLRLLRGNLRLLRLLLPSERSGLGIFLRLHLSLLLRCLLLHRLLLRCLCLDQGLLLGLRLGLLLGDVSLRSNPLTGNAIGLCLASRGFGGRLLLLLGLLIRGFCDAGKQ